MTGIFSVFFLMIRRPPRSTLFPYHDALPISVYQVKHPVGFVDGSAPSTVEFPLSPPLTELYWGFWWKPSNPFQSQDRKSTRLNSSHSQISYAVFCLKKKNTLYYTLYR